MAIASLVLPLPAARSFLQELDHRGGGNNPGGLVLFQGEKLLVAGYQELGLAGFSQREQIAVLGVGSDRAGRQILAKKRKVTKASGQQLRAMYDDVVSAGVPDRFTEMLRQLDEQKEKDKG